jgi:hypothetical protein
MVDQDTIQKVLIEFRQQGVTEVYQAECCGRTYLGRTPCTECRTCGQRPESRRVQVKELDNPTGG